MHAALDFVRAEASRRAQLDFELLSQWQRVVLESDVAFRRSDAYAKGGRERYGYDERSEPTFRAFLKEANDPKAGLPARLARAYLDVLFFHPFADGNGRSAALTADFLLTREGIVLADVGPLFMVSRSASDPTGPASLARLVEVLAGAARRRHGSGCR
jgi:hypothetical protein